MDASQAHFVRLLEVYEGDDADDADDEGDALGGGAEPAPFAANPRGLPSRFMVGDLRQRPRALTAALRHAAQRQQPAYLHVLVAAPVFESELDPKVAASLAPRWEYLAVQKALFFHFDPVEDDPAAAAAAAEAAAAAAREREEGRGYIGVEEEPEMVSASSALPLESFFQSVFLSEADGAWYLRLKHEDRQGRLHTFSEALGSFEAFLRQQVGLGVGVGLGLGLGVGLGLGLGLALGFAPAAAVRRGGMHAHRTRAHRMRVCIACACASPARVHRMRVCIACA